MWRMSRDLRGNRSRMRSPIRPSRTAAERGSASFVAPWATASSIGYEWNQAQVVRPMSPTFRFSNHMSRRAATAATVPEAVLLRPAISVTFCCYNSGRVMSERLGRTVNGFIGWRDATAVRLRGPRWHFKANTPLRSWAWRTIRRRSSDKRVGQSVSHPDYHRTHPRRESSKPDRRRIRLPKCRGRILTRRRRTGTWNKRGSQWNLPTTDYSHLIKGCRAHDSPLKTLEYPMRRHWIWDTHLEAHLRRNPPYHRLQVIIIIHFISRVSFNPYIKSWTRGRMSNFGFINFIFLFNLFVSILFYFKNQK